MRNLKRALSLALASVMVLGLMVVGSGASYADVTSEENQEAIEVLQAVGVMVGDDEGNFNPDKNVTRNEMAVVMSNLLDLKVEDFNAADIPFTDVPSWAVSYVAACYADGITSGTSATTYGGNNTVTAAQAALMMMKALGYFQNQGDFDQDWTLATIKKGSEIGIFDGITVDRTSPLTRNDVAQMALNALKLNMVTFTGDLGLVINGVEIGYRAEYTARTSANSKYNSIDVGTTDIAENNQYYVQLGEELYNGDLKLRNRTDVFGRPANYWEYDGKEVGTYVNYDMLEEEYTTEVTGKDLYDLLGATTIKEYGLTVVIDGVSDSKINSAIFTAADMNKNNKDGVGDTGNGVLTQVFLDKNDKEIIISIINTYLAIADKDYDTKKDEVAVTVYGLDKKGTEYVKVDTKNNDYEGFDIAGEDFFVEDVLEDDALLVTVAEGDIQSVAVPEIVSDSEITAFKLGSSVTVDGTKYSYASTAEYDFEVLDNYTSTTNGSNLKDTTYNVYLDQYGYAIGVDQVETPNNYVFITGVDDSYSNLSSKNVTAAAIFIDGTMDTIEVNTSKSTGLSNSATLNKWFTYTVNNSGVYTVKEVAGAIDTDKGVKVAQYADKDYNTTIDKKHISLPGNATKGNEYYRVYGNDDSVYLTASIKEITTAVSTTAIIIDDVDSVTTGIKNANIQPWEAGGTDLTKVEDDLTTKSSSQSSGVYTLYKSNGYIIASVVVGEDSAASKNLVYVYSSNVEQEGYDKATDEWTWTRKVFMNGEETELTEVGDSLSYIGNAATGEGKMAQYGWYQVKFNAENEVIGVEPASSALGANEYVSNINKLANAIDKEDTVLYDQAFKNDQPTMRGSTLYVTTKNPQGFFVDENVSIALIQWVKNDLETTFETGVDNLEDIVNDLNEKNGKFNYQISAILEDGAATSVVIYDMTNTYEKPESDAELTDGVDLSTPSDVKIRYYGKENKPSLEDTLVAIEEAIEADGYTVTDKTVKGNTYTFTAENNKTGFSKDFVFVDKKANYVRIYEVKDVTLAATTDKWAKLVDAGAGTYANGDTITLTFVKDDGSVFAGSYSYSLTGLTGTTTGTLSKDKLTLTVEIAVSGLTKDVNSWTISF